MAPSTFFAGIQCHLDRRWAHNRPPTTPALTLDLLFIVIFVSGFNNGELLFAYTCQELRVFFGAPATFRKIYQPDRA